MKNLDFRGKGKKIAFLILFLLLAGIIIFTRTGDAQEDLENAVISSENEGTEIHDKELSESDLEEMKKENAEKEFYVYSDNNGSWEEIGLLDDDRYTYIITENGQQTKNCTGFYHYESENEIILGYGGEYHTGLIENGVLYIFDKEFRKMEDSHM